ALTLTSSAKLSRADRRRRARRGHEVAVVALALGVRLARRAVGLRRGALHRRRLAVAAIDTATGLRTAHIPERRPQLAGAAGAAHVDRRAVAGHRTRIAREAGRDARRRRGTARVADLGAGGHASRIARLAGVRQLRAELACVAEPARALRAARAWL